MNDQLHAQRRAKAKDAKRRAAAMTTADDAQADINAINRRFLEQVQANNAATRREAQYLAPGDVIRPPFRDGTKVLAAVTIKGHRVELDYVGQVPGSSVGLRQMVLVIKGNEARKRRRSARKACAGHQGGLLLEDGTLVADPANALLELHDQVNGTPAPVPAPPPVPPQPAVTLADLLPTLGRDYRERETIKRRLATLLRKVQRLPQAERNAFIQLITINR